MIQSNILNSCESGITLVTHPPPLTINLPLIYHEGVFFLSALNKTIQTITEVTDGQKLPLLELLTDPKIIK